MWPRRKSKNLSGALLAEPSVDVMGYSDLNECWRLDHRCFSDGEAYDRETFRYLLSHSQSVCYKAVAPSGEMIAFIIGMIEPDGTGHVVALGVSPEYRRRGYARQLMQVIERSFIERGVRTVRLEVRTTNEAAQKLYFDLGYKIVRRMPHYYTNGDDGYLMIKDVSG
jgi:ribosomal-protein-alanine acetyltransferase